MEENKIEFADGLMFKQPSEKAPDFVLGSLYVRVDNFKAWLNKHNTNAGGVNIDIKMSKKGVPYCALSTFTPNKPKVVEDVQPDESQALREDEIDADSIPF